MSIFRKPATPLWPAGWKRALAATLCALALVLAAGCPGERRADPLTPEERAWLAAHDGKLVLGHDPGANPVEFTDKDGVFRGIAADYVAAVEKKLSFHFRKPNYPTWTEVLDKARKGGVDVIPAITRNAERDKWLLFTEPYFVVPTVILVRKDTRGKLSLDKMPGLKVTFTKGWVVEDFLRQKHSNLDLSPSDTEYQAMNRVITGRADAWVTALTTASVQIYENKVVNLRVAGTAAFSFQLAMASRKDQPILNRVLAKGLALITPEERTTIYKRWIQIGPKEFWTSREFWTVVGGVVGLGLAVVAFFLAWNFSLRRQVNIRTRELTDQLARKTLAEQALRKSENALRESEARLNLALAAAQAGTWEWDLATNANRWSRELYKLYGLDPEADRASYQGWLQSVAPEERAAMEREVRAAAAKGLALNLEWRVNDPTGPPRWLLSRGDPQLDQEGKVAKYLGIVIDISERRAMEEALKISGQRLMKAQAVAKIGNWEWDLEKQTIWGSGEFFRILGLDPQREHLSPEELEGLLQDPGPWRKAFRDMVEDGEVFDIELALLPAGGGERMEVHSLAELVADRSGRPKKVVGVLHDITERKTREAERARLDEQLQQARKMDALGTLASGIAHDFNNLLAAILGYAELTLDDLPPGHFGRHNIAQINKAAEKAKNLVRQILTFSRKTGNEKRSVSLNLVVNEALSVLERTVPKMIKLELDLTPELKPVAADFQQMEQILFNLVSNAAEAIPESGRIEISTRNLSFQGRICPHCGESLLGDFVLLAVRDNGVGITPEVSGKIFDPFFTTKDVGKGTGLGLSTVFGIATEHGGHIECQSEPGQGATFQLILPVAVQDGAGPCPTPRPPNPAEQRGGAVLVVDDEADMRDIARQMLEKNGYRVLLAQSGEQALEIHRQQHDRIAATLMDLGMPGMGGKACLKQLAALYPQAKVLVASGYIELDLSRELKALGAHGQISKPYRMAELLEALHQTLAG